MSLDLWALTQDRVQAKVAEAAALSAAGRPLVAGWLEQAAAWIGEVAPTWEQLTGSVPLARTYRRLAASPDLEAWLICWPTDGHLQLHDHGGASGAFRVIAGALDERSLVGGAGSGLGSSGAVLRDCIIPAGEVISFDGAYIHDVRNVRSPAATSVHVYGPACRPMTFYRLDGGIVRTVGHASEEALRDAERDAERRADEIEILAADRSASGSAGESRPDAGRRQGPVGGAAFVSQHRSGCQGTTTPVVDGAAMPVLDGAATPVLDGGRRPAPRLSSTAVTSPRGIDAVLAEARQQLARVDAHEAAELLDGGALLVDIRPVELRARDGAIPGAAVVGRNVLEWRLDPTCEARMPGIDDAVYERVVIVCCDEGYASSLAAADLHRIGIHRATDLIGGFQAWRRAGLSVTPPA